MEDELPTPNLDSNTLERFRNFLWSQVKAGRVPGRTNANIAVVSRNLGCKPDEYGDYVDTAKQQIRQELRDHVADVWFALAKNNDFTAACQGEHFSKIYRDEWKPGDVDHLDELSKPSLVSLQEKVGHIINASLVDYAISLTDESEREDFAMHPGFARSLIEEGQSEALDWMRKERDIFARDYAASKESEGLSSVSQFRQYMQEIGAFRRTTFSKAALLPQAHEFCNGEEDFALAVDLTKLNKRDRVAARWN